MRFPLILLLTIVGPWTSIPSLLMAQDSLLRCELIAQEEGLPDNSAWSLCEDHLGLLWIGTQLGLTRYDGHRVEVFDFEPPDSAFQRKMPINVRTLTEGPSGDLWIGTAHGEVFRFDRQTHGFIPYFLLAPKSDLNISEVSYEVGFRSPAYFSQAFSEEYGVSSSSVKKGLKEQDIL